MLAFLTIQKEESKMLKVYLKGRLKSFSFSTVISKQKKMAIIGYALGLKFVVCSMSPQI